jgi:hypothetical protein
MAREDFTNQRKEAEIMAGIGEDWLTLSDVATLLKKSRSFVFKAWPEWVGRGVRPVRIGGREKGRLLFRRAEIEQLLEHWRVS